MGKWHTISLTHSGIWQSEGNPQSRFRYHGVNGSSGQGRQENWYQTGVSHPQVSTFPPPHQSGTTGRSPWEKASLGSAVQTLGQVRAGGKTGARLGSSAFSPFLGRYNIQISPLGGVEVSLVMWCECQGRSGQAGKLVPDAYLPLPPQLSPVQHAGWSPRCHRNVPGSVEQMTGKAESGKRTGAKLGNPTLKCLPSPSCQLGIAFRFVP